MINNFASSAVIRVYLKWCFNQYRALTGSLVIDFSFSKHLGNAPLKQIAKLLYHKARFTREAIEIEKLGILKTMHKISQQHVKTSWPKTYAIWRSPVRFHPASRREK